IHERPNVTTKTDGACDGGRVAVVCFGVLPGAGRCVAARNLAVGSVTLDAGRVRDVTRAEGRVEAAACGQHHGEQELHRGEKLRVITAEPSPVSTSRIDRLRAPDSMQERSPGRLPSLERVAPVTRPLTSMVIRKDASIAATLGRFVRAPR